LDMATRMADFFPVIDDVPEKFRPANGVRLDQYLVAGDMKPWVGDYAEVVSPVCLRGDKGSPESLVIGQTPLMDRDHALQALDAAVEAYGQGSGLWPGLSVEERIAHVESFLTAMGEQRDAVVELLMWEIGKTYNDSCKEFDRTCDYIASTIEELKQLDQRSNRFERVGGVVAQIRRLPVGVALCMGPYNYPLNETFSTLIPALIMGNTVGPLMESGKVDMFAFIGTHKGAAALKQMHPRPHRLRAVLGLDANNPGIVMADADLDETVNDCVAGALSFNGQRCTALKLLFVHDSVADRFVEKLSAAVDGLKAGMPWQDGVKLTPLPEPGKTDYLSTLVENAIAGGARICNSYGGEICGTYFHPAVLYPATASMRVVTEEQFGPLVPVVRYSDIEEVIDHVRQSDFGQQLSIFGSDPEQVAYLVDTLANQVGRINLNAQCQRGPDTLPFNGRKDSAEGTLSVSDALRVFSIRTTVATKGTDRNKALVDSIVKSRHSGFLTTDQLL
jgi:glyceraldehyde-3-phosphate dehydrogenase (NADP+)